jgi:hypothetical protein
VIRDEEEFVLAGELSGFSDTPHYTKAFEVGYSVVSFGRFKFSSAILDWMFFSI